MTSDNVYYCRAVQKALDLRADSSSQRKIEPTRSLRSDPYRDPTAQRERMLTYDMDIRHDVRAVNQSAVWLARDKHLPIHALDSAASTAMLQMWRGVHIGTRIGWEHVLE